MDDRNIILFGFMGTGKSAVGRILAQRTGRPFVDLDEEIERRAGLPILDIFRIQGEARFRRIEREVAAGFAVRRGCVVATGGGIVLDPATVEDLGRTGVPICLMATLPTLLARVADEEHRPLLQSGERAAVAERLLRERLPLYEALPHRIDTDTLDPEEVADEALRIFREA
jgi:shikimate kinase